MHKIFVLQWVYFIPLHVSSTCAHHQEVKIALHSLWYHHTYRWLSCAQVERRLNQSSLNLCARWPPVISPFVHSFWMQLSQLWSTKSCIKTTATQYLQLSHQLVLLAAFISRHRCAKEFLILNIKLQPVRQWYLCSVHRQQWQFQTTSTAIFRVIKCILNRNKCQLKCGR